MQYYAKVNTASPATGFISVGDVLTDKQAEALGEDKLNELVKENVLGICADGEKPANAIIHEEDEGVAEKEAGDDKSETGAEDADDTDEEETQADEELPELALTNDMVNDQTEESKATKKGGRRKAK